jgi:hypothetical protein
MPCLEMLVSREFKQRGSVTTQALQQIENIANVYHDAVSIRCILHSL